MTIPVGLCQCGCGEQTRLAPKTRRRSGQVRGEPLRYVHGHNRGDIAALVTRFWAKVAKDGPVHPVLGTRCWLWTGAHHDGEFRYGITQWRTGAGVRQSVRAHRISWELTNGPIPESLFALHKCDEPRCVNPAHLFLGTAADNTADMIQKGRQKGGPAWKQVSC